MKWGRSPARLSYPLRDEPCCVLTSVEMTELPPEFRLPRVTYHRSHHERGDDADTEAAIHIRVEESGSHASQRRADSRSGRLAAVDLAVDPEMTLNPGDRIDRDSFSHALLLRLLFLLFLNRQTRIGSSPKGISVGRPPRGLPLGVPQGDFRWA